MGETTRKIIPYAAKGIKRTGTDNIPIPTHRPPMPEPKCLLCRDAGFTRMDVPYGHPMFAKRIPCACKLVEIKGKQQKKLVEHSGMMNLSSFKDASFETFNLSVPDVKRAHKAASQFAACPMGWLVLTGPYGCGKTLLAATIAKARLDAGDTVIFQTVPDLLDYLRSAFAPGTQQSYEERFTQMKEADVLILDDYKAENETTWAAEKMFQLLNYRYNGSLPTVITTNDIHLTSVEPRVASRLGDEELVTVIKMVGARDYRPYKKQKGQ